MSATKSAHDLKSYVIDLYSRVTRGVPAFHRQLERLRGQEKSDVAQALQSFREDLQLHRSSLEQRIRVLGGGTWLPLRASVTFARDFLSGVLGRVQAQPMSEHLREDYVFLGDLAAAYLRLFTIAGGVSDPPTAQLADRGYRDCIRMMRTIERVMPGLLIHEVRQTGAIASDVSEQAQALVQNARATDEVPVSAMAGATHPHARLVVPS